MERKEIKKIVSGILSRKGYSLAELILFGSRAKAGHNKNSDWDLLVVVSEKIDINIKRELAREIREAFAEIYEACDVIIKSVPEKKYYAGCIGSIVREAVKEGTAI